MNNLDYALQYAELGWKILPLHFIRENGVCSCHDGAKCKTPGKHPATMNGVDDATSDPEKLRHLFRDVRLNVGAAAYPFQIVDIDPRNGGDKTWTELTRGNILPDTAIQMTGGGGLHFLFNVPVGKKLKRGPGIDIKKTGSYIVVEPSNHYSGGEYFWDGAFSPLDGQVIADAPDWLLEVDATTAPQHTGTGILLDFEIQQIKDALSWLDPDAGYDFWLEVIQCLHSTGASEAFELADKWSQRSKCYDLNELRKKWGSFTANKGRNIESVYYHAGQAGWQRHTPDIQIDLKPKKQAIKQHVIPPHLLTPPGILNTITQQIISTARMPQPVFAVNAALSLVATLAARKVQSETGLRTNLYFCSLGPTGCGKEHARNFLKTALHTLGKDEQLGGEDIASGQGLMSRAALSPDAVFQIDELGHFLASATDKNAAGHKVAVLTSLMKLFSSSSSVVTGTEYANQKLNERQMIEYPCINVHGTSTDNTFYDALKGVHILDGFVNRLIVTQTDTPRPKKQRNKPAAKPDQAIIDWYDGFITHISKGLGLLGIQAENPVTIRMTKGAWDLFDKLDDLVDDKMEEVRGTGLDALYVRMWEHAAKIALVCGCAKAIPLIDIEEARWAIDFVCYWTDRLVQEARYRIADSEFGHLMNLVLQRINDAGNEGITHGRAFNHKKLREMPPQMRQQIITTLAENGEIVVNAKKAEGAGRPSMRYFAAAANC